MVLEGFLWKKGRGESSIGRRNWKKRWFILDGQLLHYYESYDPDRCVPVNEKGIIPLAGGEVKMVKHPNRSHCFVVKTEAGKPVYLDADTDEIKFMWMEQLDRAIRNESRSNRVDTDKYLELLGFPPGEIPPITDMSKAYKRAALRAHPDKGGDVQTFKLLQEAYQKLTQMKDEQDNYKRIEFVATVEKGVPGVGFGMIVVEDPISHLIIVKSVLPVMQLRAVEPEEVDGIKAKDVLIMIDDDSTEGWTLTQVVQRLSDYRVAVGKTVRLRFSRKVRLDGKEDEEQSQPFSPGSPGTQPESPDPQDRSPRPMSPSEASEGWDNTASPVQIVSLKSQIDYLTEELEQTKNGMKTTVAERDRLQELSDSCNNELELLKAEKAALLRKIEESETAALESSRKTECLELQLQQLILNAQLPREQKSSKEIRDLREILTLIKSKREVTTSDENEEFLNKLGLTKDRSRGSSVDHAKRTALIAASMVDLSGNLLKKWSLNGNVVNEKLNRLDSRLARLRSFNSNARSSSAENNKAGAFDLPDASRDSLSERNSETIVGRSQADDGVAEDKSSRHQRSRTEG